MMKCGMIFTTWIAVKGLKVKVLVTQSCLTLFDPRLLCPWNFSGKNTGVGCLSLLQGIFPTQGLNSGLPTLQVDSLSSEPPGKLKVKVIVAQSCLTL